jgi:hypothetical protein
MSELRCGRRFAPGLLFLASALFHPGPALEAQSVGDSAVAAVREELDSLIPLMRRLGERANSAEYRERMRRLREDQIPVDTFTVGPFRVVSLPDQRELAEEVIRATWDELRPLVDGSEDLLEPWTFLIYHYWSREGMILSGDSLLRRIEMSRRYPRSYLHEGDASGARILERRSAESLARTPSLGGQGAHCDTLRGGPPMFPGGYRMVW